MPAKTKQQENPQASQGSEANHILTSIQLVLPLPSVTVCAEQYIQSPSYGWIDYM